MRQTKENVVKLLSEMSKNARSVAESFAPKNPIRASSFRAYAMAYDEAIWLLTDANYFNEIAKIYGNSISPSEEAE